MPIINSQQEYKGAGVIVRDVKGRYLRVVGRDHGKWGFPKGEREDGETTRECAIRELKEETGLDMWINKNAKKWHNYNMYFFINLKFEITSPLTTQDDNEIAKVQWVSAEELQSFQRHQVNADAWKFARQVKQ